MTDIASKPDYGTPIGLFQGRQVNLSEAFQNFFDDLEEKLNANLLGSVVQLPSYTVATVPTASSFVAGIIFVTDETGGAVPAFSDGTVWRRVTDRAVIS